MKRVRCSTCGGFLRDCTHPLPERAPVASASPERWSDPHVQVWAFLVVAAFVVGFILGAR